MENEMLEQTNNEVLETTNTENVAAVENVVEDVTTEPTQETVTKSLKELLKENPEYQSEYNSMIESRLKRQRREYDNKYSRVETVLNAGLGTNSIEEATTKLEGFYKEKGIEIPSQSDLSEEDYEYLGKEDANKYIKDYDYEEVIERVDELANIGVDNMTPRQLAQFKNLAEYRQIEGRKRELTSIGVKEDLINSNEFKEFASQFNERTPMKNVYELYKKTLPEPKVEPIGSMKSDNKPVKKDYYTPEELSKLTSADLDDPEVMKAAEYSMQQHYLESHRR